MKKRNALRALLALLILISVAVSVPSCRSKDENKNDDNNGGTSNATPSFMERGSTLSLSYDGANGYSWNEEALRSRLNDMGIKVADGSSQVLIIGESEHHLYRSAKKQIDDVVTDTSTTAGYAIYSSKDGVAVAYTSPLALDEALDRLFEIAGTDGITEKGVLASASFDIDSRIESLREKYREEALAELGKTWGEDIAAAVSELYSLYDSDWYIWLANLYDPETGAFYFSNSARNSIGFLPDLESTMQVLDTISWSGAFSHYELPEGVDKAYGVFIDGALKERLLSFIHSMQDTDGYYYHPQWGKEINSSRRGRDLNHATDLLTELRESPLYDTPNGYKGSASSPVAMTSRLGTSAVIAASAVISTASPYPDYLNDTEKWLEYIKGLDIPNDSYTAGNIIESQSTQIIEVDKALWVSQGAGRTPSQYSAATPAKGGYIEILFDYLKSIQNPDTGFWQIIEDKDDIDGAKDGLTYEGINGMMKLSSCYAKMKQPFSYAEAAVESIITVAKYAEDAQDTHICSIYNPWAALGYIYRTLDTATKEALQAKVRAAAPEMLMATVEKLAKHKMDGGGFSYFESRPCNNSQGAEVACSAKPESDVNAATISVMGIAGAVFNSMGIKLIAPYIPADGDRFVDMIYSLGIIIKDEPAKLPTGSFFDSDYPGERSDYDSDELPPKIQIWPESKMPDATIENKDGVIVFTKEMAQNDPVNPADSDEYISFDCYSKAPDKNSVQVFELDVKFSGLEGNAGSFSKFEFYADGAQTYVYIKANASGQVYFVSTSGKAYKATPYLESDTWYKLRFEFYYKNDGGEIKVYVDNKYACTLTGLAIGTTTGHSRGFVYLHRGYDGATISMDNVYTGFAEKAYTEGADVTHGVLDPSKGYYLSGVESGNLYDWYEDDFAVPEIQIWPANKIADATLERYLGGIKFTKKKAVGCTVNPDDNEEYFYLNYSSGHVPATNSVEIFETDIIFGDLDTHLGCFGKFQFYSGTKRVNIDVYVDSNGKIYFADKDGRPIDGTPTLSQGVKYKLRFEIYYGEEDTPVKLYVDNVFTVTLTDLYVSDKVSGNNRVFIYLHKGFEGAYMIMSDIFCGYDSIKYKEESPIGTWDAPLLTGSPLKPTEPTPPDEPDEPTIPDEPDAPITPEEPDIPEEPSDSEKGEFDGSENLNDKNHDSDGWVTTEKDKNANT